MKIWIYAITTAVLIAIGPSAASLLFIPPEYGYYPTGRCLCGYTNFYFIKDGKLISASFRHNDFTEFYYIRKIQKYYSTVDFKNRPGKLELSRTKIRITDEKDQSTEIKRSFNLWPIWYDKIFSEKTFRYRNIEKMNPVPKFENTEPNKALQTTIMADTPAASHPSRQP